MDEKTKMDAVMTAFENRKDIQSLKRKERAAMDRFDIATVMEIRGKMRKELDRMMEAMIQERRSLYETVEGMSDEDKSFVMAGIHALLYLSDAFVGIMGDINATLKKKDRFAKLDAFQRMTRLFKDCENEVSFLLRDCSMEYKIGFATRSDEVREMLVDYARRAIEEGNGKYIEEADKAYT